jgi:hypothetical protein
MSLATASKVLVKVFVFVLSVVVSRFGLTDTLAATVELSRTGFVNSESFRPAPILHIIAIAPTHNHKPGPARIRADALQMFSANDHKLPSTIRRLEPQVLPSSVGACAGSVCGCVIVTLAFFA